MSQPVLDLAGAVDRAVALTRRPIGSRRRALIGIAGAPGAGKSTYAAGLVGRVRALGVRAELVPMDGFHLAHRVLVASGDVAVKGHPRTFDAAGYVALLGRIRAAGDETVWAPAFDRDLEDAIAGSIAVGPEVELVVTEGNYLLLDTGPWWRVREVLDECWFLDLPDDVRRRRLAARHEAHGRTAEEAHERTHGSDEVNARLVLAGKARAQALLADAGPSADVLLTDS